MYSGTMSDSLTPNRRVPLVVRSDATPEIGAGHVMRCAALAESWLAAGLGPVTFVGAVTIPFARARVEALGVAVVSSYGGAPGADAVLVCDSYDHAVRADAAQHRREYALRVLVDDLGGIVPSGFDVVWNPNAYESIALYPGFSGELVAGAGHVPLRSQLPAWRTTDSCGTAVMLGGSRLPDSLVRALHSIQPPADGAKLYGAGNWAPSTWGSLDTRDPWPVIASCARLVTSSGTTIWEAAYVGIPVVVVRIAHNQDLIFDWAMRSGAAAVDALDREVDSHHLASRINDALEHARPLPRIRNGAPNTCGVLRALALRTHIAERA